MKDPKDVPSSSTEALRKAMMLEGVPAREFDDYLWIMAQESVGVPGIHSSGSSASGLFQLLEEERREFYPHGDASIGNGIEEAQGGIRYVMSRYGSASAARRHWETYHWY